MSATVIDGVIVKVADEVLADEVNVVTGLFAGVVGDSSLGFFGSGSGSEQDSSSESAMNTNTL
jgi:hypothetical protein